MTKDWRPPGWIVGDLDEPYTPEDREVDGVTIPGVETRFAEFVSAGYCTKGGALLDFALGKPDEQECVDIIHNHRLLRDAWNTHPTVWRLYAAIIGREALVDAFYNDGGVGLPALRRKLDGLAPEDDGMLTVAEAKRQIGNDDITGASAKLIKRRIKKLGDVPDDFPVNWRGELEPGTAVVAANGPHSCTVRWLALCRPYGALEFVGAFVPDNGDGWFQQHAMAADIVVRLGRVPCISPPGVPASNSPRGASALCIWVPDEVKTRLALLYDTLELAAQKDHQDAYDATLQLLDELLPAPTRDVLLTGKAYRVKMWDRPRSGPQYAIVQRSGIDMTDDADVVDFGDLT